MLLDDVIARLTVLRRQAGNVPVVVSYQDGEYEFFPVLAGGSVSPDRPDRGVRVLLDADDMGGLDLTPAEGYVALCSWCDAPATCRVGQYGQPACAEHGPGWTPTWPR